MRKSGSEKVEKLLFYIFDKFILSIDRYKNNGSLWVINTEKQNWILEFTENNTLWYNYQFFEKKMRLCNLDCVDNKDLIQKWFESRYLNINQVKQTELSKRDFFPEDIFQNGVKNTFVDPLHDRTGVEDTIQNGVKHTRAIDSFNKDGVEDTTQNGVKNTVLKTKLYFGQVEDTIQNGVKLTLPESIPDSFGINDAIQNGVKETWEGWMHGLHDTHEVIRNGVKETFQENHHRRREVMGVINKIQQVYHRPESTIKNVIKRNKNK